MRYHTIPKSGDKLSVLGFGCMRFPRKLLQTDMDKTEKLILEAIERGVNYFDTAYNYPGSEEALGAILHKNGLRRKVFVATKLPLRKCQTHQDFDRLFQKQLARLRTDYIDYYLMHNLSDTQTWRRLCAIGVIEWLAAKKASGEIRQVGFSFHGVYDEFLWLLDAYAWDFCQIQYNYININYQAGAAGLQKAAAQNLPVFIMEPLLGGKLAANLPPEIVKIFQKTDPSLSPVAWALRWLWNQPEVAVVLSGMNNFAQLKENIAVAANTVPGALSERERAIFGPVTEAFRSAYKIPCTECNYCLPCPQRINIPGCFAAYNLSYASGRFAGLQQYLIGTGATDPAKNYTASKCKKCGKCEERCPQHIPIAKLLADVSERLEPFWVKAAIKIFNKLTN